MWNMLRHDFTEFVATVAGDTKEILANVLNDDSDEDSDSEVCTYVCLSVCPSCDFGKIRRMIRPSP